MAEIFMTEAAKNSKEEFTKAKPAGVETKVKPASMGKRVRNAFIAEDRGDIKEHVIFEVVIPAIKNAISDVITDGIDMLLFGEKKRKTSNKTAYGSFWASSIDSEKKRENGRSGASEGHSSRSALGRYSDACWESRKECEDVLECLEAIMDSYSVITVADFFGLIDDPREFPIESIHSKWGWKSLKDVHPERVGNGLWGLSLPRPTRLD